MKRLALKLAVFLLVAVLANLLTVAALPRLINLYVLHKIAVIAGGENRPLPAPRADANARTVVRPSPDLLYTACVYDVSERPLHITAPAQESYVSISGFAADTHNFFAIDNADGKKNFDLILAREGAGVTSATAQVIAAPSARGLILFRSLISSEAELPRLQRDFQSRQSCAPYAP